MVEHDTTNRGTNINTSHIVKIKFRLQSQGVHFHIAD